MTVLDTDVVSKFIDPRAQERNPGIIDFVRATAGTSGLAISYVTRYELRRGFEELALREQSRGKRVAGEKFLAHVDVLGLDEAGGEGWNVAARLWARARVHKPGIVFKDADLLNAATAAFHGRDFATADVGLAEGLEDLGMLVPVHLLGRS